MAQANQKTKLRDITAKISGRVSGDPRHTENRLDPDFQAGYFMGILTENESSFDITQEWELRGKPKGDISNWKSWKSGYWAGRYSVLGEK